MHERRPQLLTKAVNRFQRWTLLARERARGVPLRLANRGHGPPIPPPRLMRLVAASEDVAWFLGAGERAAEGIREVLLKHGARIEELGAILDFGCGAGRVLRHWHGLSGPGLHGTDYNPDLIAWCTRNLPHARFQVNGLNGPLNDPAETFDLVYALSVFTHLDEPLQQYWVGELTRVLRPGGYLYLTTHGAAYLAQLEPRDQERFRGGEVVVLRSNREGSNDCAAFHPESYVRRALARGLKVVDFLPEGAKGNPRQDAYLLQKGK